MARFEPRRAVLAAMLGDGVYAEELAALIDPDDIIDWRFRRFYLRARGFWRKYRHWPDRTRMEEWLDESLVPLLHNLDPIPPDFRPWPVEVALALSGEQFQREASRPKVAGVDFPRLKGPTL